MFSVNHPDMFQDNEGNMFVRKNNGWVRVKWQQDERGRVFLKPVEQEIVVVPYTVDDRVLTRGKIVKTKPIEKKPVSVSRHYKTVETGVGQHKQYAEIGVGQRRQMADANVGQHKQYAEVAVGQRPQMADANVGQHKQYAEVAVGSQPKETAQQAEQTSWWSSLFGQQASSQTQPMEESTKEVTVHYIPIYREKECKPCKPCKSRKRKSPKRKSPKRMSKTEKLRNKNMEQLLRQAKRLNISGRHSLRKEELVQKIRRKI